LQVLTTVVWGSRFYLVERRGKTSVCCLHQGIGQWKPATK